MITFTYNTAVEMSTNMHYHTKQNLDLEILKKGRNVCGDGNERDEKNDFKSRVSKLLYSGVEAGNQIVEVYRRDFGVYDFYANGYVNYLFVAYLNDLGIEVSPPYIWNIIVHQIASIVKTNVEEFQNIFTKSSSSKIEVKIEDKNDY